MTFLKVLAGAAKDEAWAELSEGQREMYLERIYKRLSKPRTKGEVQVPVPMDMIQRWAKRDTLP